MSTTIVREDAEDGIVSIHEFGDGTASLIDSFVHSRVCDQRQKTGYLAVSDAEERASAESGTADNASLALNASALEARDAATLLEQRAADPREGVSADQLAAAKRQAQKARTRQEEASAHARRTRARRDGLAELKAACDQLLRRYRPRPATSGGGLLASTADGSFPVRETNWLTSKPLTQAPATKLPARHKLPEFVAEKRARLAELRAKRKETASAPLPPEMVKAQLRAKVSALASAGQLRVNTDAGAVDLVWPMKALNAEPPRNNPSAVPRAIDTEAVLAFLFGDRIIEEAARAVDEAYEGTELVLDPFEKRKQLAELDAQLLELERAEVDAILALLAAGDRSIDFRPGTDPRAILGLA